MCPAINELRRLPALVHALQSLNNALALLACRHIYQKAVAKHEPETVRLEILEVVDTVEVLLNETGPVGDDVDRLRELVPEIRGEIERWTHADGVDVIASHAQRWIVRLGGHPPPGGWDEFGRDA